MVEVLLILATLLFASALASFGLYYRRLRKVNYEYVEAKNILSDIILSFNRQLRRLDEKAGYLAHKLEAHLSREEHVTKDKQAEAKLAEITAKITELTETKNTTMQRIEELNKKIIELTELQKNLEQKISETPERKTLPKEPKIKAAIPIRREKALEPLTVTELTVLEFLAAEGEKTAPQIKEAIKLTREHTARLMKKLYEEGYVERNAQKKPYTYRIKEEMRKILRKTEEKST
jgi:CTP-dependent riboflavin kinase